MTTAEKTRLLVGGLIGAGILAYIWIAPIFLYLKIIFTVAGIWEAYTLVNKDKDDTISDSIAYLAGISQLVPLLFGTVYGYALGKGLITDPIVASAFGGLLCHFFFSLKQTEVKATHEVIREEVKAEVVEDIRDSGIGSIRLEGKEGK